MLERLPQTRGRELGPEWVADYADRAGGVGARCIEVYLFLSSAFTSLLLALRGRTHQECWVHWARHEALVLLGSLHYSYEACFISLISER